MLVLFGSLLACLLAAQANADESKICSAQNCPLGNTALLVLVDVSTSDATDPRFRIRVHGYLSSLLETFEDRMSAGHLRIAVLTHGKSVKIIHKLCDKQNFDTFHVNIQKIKLAKGTYDPIRVYEYVKKYFKKYTAKADSRILVHVTNGLFHKTRALDRMAETLRKSGVTVQMVGASSFPNGAILGHLASKPRMSHIHRPVDGDLRTTIRSMLSSICSDAQCMGKSKKIGDKCFVQEDSCEGKLELAWLIDSTASMTKAQFDELKSFAKNVTAQLDVGPEATQVSIITFDTTSRVEFWLDQTENMEPLLNVFNKIPFTAGMNTNTHIGLYQIRTEVFKQGNGVRCGVPKVVVVLTDGAPSYGSSTRKEGEKMRSDGTVLLAVGVGNFNANSLAGMTGDPKKIYKTHQVKDLHNFLGKVTKSACKAVKEDTTANRKATYNQQEYKAKNP